MATVLNFLLFFAFIGMLGAFLGKFFDALAGVLSKLLSYVILAVFWGILLFGIMWLACFLGYANDYHIFGYHPFWVGFVPCMIYQILKGIINFFQNR